MKLISNIFDKWFNWDCGEKCWWNKWNMSASKWLSSRKMIMYQWYYNVCNIIKIHCIVLPVVKELSYNPSWIFIFWSVILTWNLPEFSYTECSIRLASVVSPMICHILHLFNYFWTQYIWVQVINKLSLNPTHARTHTHARTNSYYYIHTWL